MTCYQVLRKGLKCGTFTAGFIAALNFLFDVPKNEIRFMHMIIEFDPEEEL